jgi:hypothetical protein
MIRFSKQSRFFTLSLGILVLSQIVVLPGVAGPATDYNPPTDAYDPSNGGPINTGCKNPQNIKSKAIQYEFTLTASELSQNKKANPAVCKYVFQVSKQVSVARILFSADSPGSMTISMINPQNSAVIPVSNFTFITGKIDETNKGFNIYPGSTVTIVVAHSSNKPIKNLEIIFKPFEIVN